MIAQNAFKSAMEQYVAANRTEASARELTQLYATSSTVGACADFRADMVSQVPMRVMRRGEPLEADHPLQHLFSGRYSFPNLMRRSELAMAFWGRNLLHKRRNAFGVPVQLDWVNPNIYSVDVGMTGLRGFRVYASTMYQIEPTAYIKASEGVYMHGVDFNDDYDGIGEVERAFLEASIEPEKAQTQVAIFRNMAFLGGIAQPPADMPANGAPTKDDRDNLINFLARRVRGALGAGTFLVSPKRWEWLTLQAPLKDLELRTVTEDARLSVCIAFRIPLELIVPSAANYAQFEGARRTWGHAWLVPRCDWYASVFTEQLVNDFGDEWKVVPDYAAVPFLKEDATTKVTTINAKVSGGLLSLYDAQKALGDEPDDRLKDLYVIGGVPTPADEVRNVWRYSRLIAPSVFNSELITGEPLPQPVDPNAVVPTVDGGEPVAAADGAPVPADPAKDENTGTSLCIMLDLANHPDLIGLQARLKELYTGQAIEWNDPADFHTTVLYAPVVSEAQAAQVQAGLVALEVPALTLGVGSLNTFDNLGNYALHFRIKQNADLIDFQESVYDLCIAAGVPVSVYSNPASFKPHITMGYASVKPRNVTFASKIAVQPTSLFMTLGDGANVVWRSDVHAGVDAPLDAVPTETPIPDDQFKDLKNWETLVNRKGTEYPFKSSALPQLVRDYVQVALADGDGVQAFADARTWLRGGVKSYTDTKAAFVAEMVRIIGAGQASESSRQQFSGQMNSAARRFGLVAFRDGMNSEGLDPESFDKDQLATFRAWQDETSTYIKGLRDELFKEGGITESEVAARADAWANKSLRDIYYRGAALAAADKPKRWKRNPQKDSCVDCVSRDGKVLTYKEWAKQGLPGDSRLACHGDHCGCDLEDVA